MPWTLFSNVFTMLKASSGPDRDSLPLEQSFKSRKQEKPNTGQILFHDILIYDGC